MGLVQFENLVKVGQLKDETYNEQEYQGLIHSGLARFQDACNRDLSQESRFDLAYNAAHALSLGALRRQGYRSVNRYIVFQVLPYTLGVGQEVWRVLDVCHNRRNLAEYEGYLEIDDRLLEELLLAVGVLADAIKKMPPA